MLKKACWTEPRARATMQITVGMRMMIGMARVGCSIGGL